MSQTIESILNKPSKAKETEYNIITTMSDNINKKLEPVASIMSWWGNKEIKSSKKSLLNGNQITLIGEKWEENRSTKRK